MSSLNLFHPFNIPNLLTPSRGHLEIQYVIFSFIFLSLFGYVAYEFFDISFIIIIVSCIVLFIILYFLYFVLKERDSVDEAVLTSEITEKDTDNEMLRSIIDKKEKELLNLQQGDKRNADDENRLKREIREDRLKKLRLERDLASYDQTFVNDVQGIRKSNNGETVQTELQNRLAENQTELDAKLNSLEQKTTQRGVGTGLGLVGAGSIGALKKDETDKKTAFEDGKSGLVEAENKLRDLKTDKEFLDQKKKEAKAEETAATVEKAKADADAVIATADTATVQVTLAAATTPSEKIDLQNQLFKAREVENKAKAKQKEAKAKQKEATAKVTAVNDSIAAKSVNNVPLDQQVTAAEATKNTAQGNFTAVEKAYNDAKQAVIDTRKKLEKKLKSDDPDVAREAAEKLYGETTIKPEDRRDIDALLKKKEDLEKALDKSRILSGKEDSMDVETAKITLRTNNKRIENYEQELKNLESEKTGITDNTEKRRRDLAALYVKTSDLDERQRINAEINSLENKRNRELDRLNQKQYDLNLERLELSTQNQSLFQDYKSEIASKESEKKARDLRNAYDEEYRNFEKDSDRLAAYYKLKDKTETERKAAGQEKLFKSLEKEITISDTTARSVKLNQRYKNIKKRACERAEASKELADKIQGADVEKLSNDHLRLLEDYINDRQIEGEQDVSGHITKRNKLREHLRLFKNLGKNIL